MQVEYFRAKSLVREEPDGNVHLNPYAGCQHDCAYCDGKAEHYNMHEDFGTRIRVKENAPRLLEDYLRRRGFLPVNRRRTGTLLDVGIRPAAMPKKFVVGISGGVCDVYQPAEAEVGMSRWMLEVVRDYGLPVSLLTKNKLVLRDLDLLKEISAGAGATVCMTVVFSRGNERLREIFEPGASTIAERFDALRVLSGNGIKTGIWMLPILPWLGDSDENLEGVVRDAVAAGVGFILPAGLTLKPGRSKDEFMRCLDAHFPELVRRYAAFYGNDNRYGQPDAARARELGVREWRPALDGLCARHGLTLADW